MNACKMTDRDRSLAWAAAVVIGSTLAKALAFFLAVLKPSEQMNAQTMLPPKPSPTPRDEYRP